MCCHFLWLVSHRKWRKERFKGREGEIYTVIGKGGLIREILVPTVLAKQLEIKRLHQPITTFDRKIKYQQYYDIGGGKKCQTTFREYINNMTELYGLGKF